MVSNMTKRTEPTDEEWLTPGETAAILGVSVRSCARYADEGVIEAIRPGGHRRYLRASVEAVVTQS